MSISTFCEFNDQKREYDIILCDDVLMMHFTTDGFQIRESTKYNHMQSGAIHENNIILSFLIIKFTEC